MNKAPLYNLFQTARACKHGDKPLSPLLRQVNRLPYHMSPDPVFLAFAEKHASTVHRLPSAIVAEANALSLDFDGYIEHLCGR